MLLTTSQWLSGMSLLWEYRLHFGFLLPGGPSSIAAGLFLRKEHIQATGGVAFSPSGASLSSHHSAPKRLGS